MQRGCTLQGILLPSLLPHLLLALCHRTGTSGTLRRQRLLPRTHTYAPYGFLPIHCSTFLLYGRPLEMEFVPEDTLLGVTLSTLQRTITFRQPPHLTLIRSNRTAGSPQMALAGFFTRGILICRLTRPRHLIFPQLIDLTQQYLDKNFTMNQLLPLLHQLCHRFHLPRQPLHSQRRFLTFSTDAAPGTPGDKLERRFSLCSSLCQFPSLHYCTSTHLPVFLTFQYLAQTPVPSDMSRPTPSDLTSTGLTSTS